MPFPRSFFIVFAAGAALALTLPKPGLSLLAWFSPAVLFWVLRQTRSLKQAILWGSVYGFAFCGISLFWIYTTCRFAGVPIPVSLLAIVVLAAVLCLNWAVYGGAVYFTSEKFPPAAHPWIWALLWTAIESACAHWTPRVGVDLLAYTQYKYLTLIQIGALLGPHALGFVIILFNGALAAMVRQEAVPYARKNLAAAGCIVFACALYGLDVLSNRSSDTHGVRIEVLQANIDQYQKWDADYERSIRASYEALLERPREAAPKLIVWPESSLPGWLDQIENKKWITQQAMRVQAPMLVGAVYRDALQHYNSAALIDEKGDVLQIYHKRQLVPFGEFVPLRKFFEGWIGILAQMGDFDSGYRDQPLFIVSGLRIAANICYEAVFPHLLRGDAARGARVFVNLTNDGWYKNTAGPYQHFYTNVYRAVENRVTVIRAANTGISGVIDPYGVILGRTHIGEHTRLDMRLPSRDDFPTGSFYARQGDVFGMGAFFLSIGLLIFPLIKQRLKR